MMPGSGIVAVRTLALDIRKLAGKWNDPALETVLGRDSRLRHRTKEDLLDRATMILDDLDDLAVLVLFSIFEANVRARTRADVERETSSIHILPCYVPSTTSRRPSRTGASAESPRHRRRWTWT